MKKPEFSSEIVFDLSRGENNPRNSEGDFAVLKNGSILFAYSKYTGSSGDDDAPCDIAALISSDRGRSFRRLPSDIASAKQHSTSNIMSVSFARLRDGTLCLFYLCKYGAGSEYIMRRCYDEDNLVFGRTETVIPKSGEYYYVVNNCRVLVLDNGKLLVPAAMHKIFRESGGAEDNEYYARSVFYKGDCRAKSWERVSPVLEIPDPKRSATGLQEPGTAQLPDGRIYAYFRTDSGFQYESFSSSSGGSWSVPVQSGFTSPESPMLIKRNPYSGLYYAVWNPVPYCGSEAQWIHAGRNPLVIAVSENGIDFSPYTVIENEPGHGYCYPAVLFLSESEMLLSYCCGSAEDGNCLCRTAVRRIDFKM